MRFFHNPQEDQFRRNNPMLIKQWEDEDNDIKDETIYCEVCSDNEAEILEEVDFKSRNTTYKEGICKCCRAEQIKMEGGLKSYREARQIVGIELIAQ